jgi:hypothetical protein
MSDTPPRKTYWRQIGITTVCGVVLAAGSCFGLAQTFMHPSGFATLSAIGFIAGVITVVVSVIWLLVEVVKSILRG